MGGETLTDSWFSNLWKNSRKSRVSEPQKAVIGILAFEVVTLMYKVVHLWQCLSDKQINGLRENISNSLGIRRLVSDDDDYLMDLALAEIIDNLRGVAKAVARFGKKCVDPVYHHLEDVFDDPFKIGLNWCGWEYRLKKMERKVRKMERFVANTAQLSQEMEVLAELEQTLRRMQGNVDLSRVKLLEFHQKVMWQQQEVRHLREMSPWVRTYDYTVRLLLRSLFTIISRIKHVFDINHMATSVGGNSNPEGVNGDCLLRSNSISLFMQSSVHPSDNNPDGFYSGRLGRSISNLGPTTDKIRTNYKHRQSSHLPSTICGKSSQLKTRQSGRTGPFKGCITGAGDSPVVKSCVLTSSGYLRSSVFSNAIDKRKDAHMDSLSCGSIFHSKVFVVNSKHKLLNAPASTLGYAGLALHYANVIILIEKLASAPHLISLDARDDLYNMLPTSVRTSLRVKLKLFAKTAASSVHDAALAAEWSLALARILEWLAPLAHNMIRWHSERNFEKQHMVSGVNVLLVQALYFANQLKTEAAITELVMGLNYLSRFGRELNEKVFLESACSRACDDFLLQRENIACV